MNHSIREVLRYLAGNENIEVIPLDYLQKLADEHPYFPVARLLLTKKLKAEKNTDFLQQAQKTALYFSNPYWLDYQLANELWQHMPSGENNFTSKEIATDEAEQADTPNEILATDTHLADHNKEEASQPQEEMAAITRDTDAATEEFLNQVNTQENSFVHDDIAQIMETQIPAGIETTEVMEEMAGVSRETDETAESFLNETAITTKENDGLSPETETLPPEAENVLSVTENNKENKKDENGEPDEHERMFQNIKAMLDATSEEADADTKNAAIPIDPYYTIDYFASQGIKLELEQNPKDQLGQHLKKFTHWLKYMKKLGPEDATEVITRTHTEADIQKIAESSNTVREVVTEAMASVLEKQGKKDKAIELYKKLGFLNPDKSAYFAVKIKNLKGI